MYRVDGELIAIGVVDILPSCVSSVYFIYSLQWAWASLGKVCVCLFSSGLSDLSEYEHFRRSEPWKSFIMPRLDIDQFADTLGLTPNPPLECFLIFIFYIQIGS